MKATLKYLAREGIQFERSRSCADCTVYAPEAEMREQNDGRLVCASCDKRARRLAQYRAQLSLLGQRPLF